VSQCRLFSWEVIAVGAAVAAAVAAAFLPLVAMQLERQNLVHRCSNLVPPLVRQAQAPATPVLQVLAASLELLVAALRSSQELPVQVAASSEAAVALVCSNLELRLVLAEELPVLQAQHRRDLRPWVEAFLRSVLRAVTRPRLLQEEEEAASSVLHLKVLRRWEVFLVLILQLHQVQEALPFWAVQSRKVLKVASLVPLDLLPQVAVVQVLGVSLEQQSAEVLAQSSALQLQAPAVEVASLGMLLQAQVVEVAFLVPHHQALVVEVAFLVPCHQAQVVEVASLVDNLQAQAAEMASLVPHLQAPVEEVEGTSLELHLQPLVVVKREEASLIA